MFPDNAAQGAKKNFAELDFHTSHALHAFIYEILVQLSGPLGVTFHITLSFRDMHRTVMAPVVHDPEVKVVSGAGVWLPLTAVKNKTARAISVSRLDIIMHTSVK